ncbi:chlorophyllide a oxygenase, chloroplastic [Selaginella moellendorffii]|nr:chlorophyllide a oxygenase, chloroplastic [Selaginella moellendorffii]|eukprot:XP_002983761.2 chlorophyllide a oxygenase, chloroplastic [Selaginella moellendorffii]
MESALNPGARNSLFSGVGISNSLEVPVVLGVDLGSSSRLFSRTQRKRLLRRCRRHFCVRQSENGGGVSCGMGLEIGDFSHADAERGSRVIDVNQAWELLRHDVEFLDLRARQDVLAIKDAHDKVVEVLNPLARETKSINTLKRELANLQEDLQRAHAQVHISEARVNHTISKLAEMETMVNDELLQKDEEAVTVRKNATSSKSKGLNIAGPVKRYPAEMKNYWYPVAFSACLDSEKPLAIEIFEKNWVLFRGKDGRAGCIHDACAHRACPLSLGKVNDGCLQCPYHGWEYATSGSCEKMPSTRFVPTKVKSMPCIEKDGLVWIWPGSATPESDIPSLLPPDNFTLHAEIILDLEVEHGLLMENLLDLAHAPFTHTTTFAKGWSVPSSVKFQTPVETLRGYWDPYPIDMEFRRPCMVLSTIGLAKPGKLEGSDTQSCKNHLHQLHVCIPSTRGKTRLLYRMSLDFAPWLKYVPFIQTLWVHLARKVLDEDLRLVEGQQERMVRGANVWNLPVPYDKLGVRYRKWRVSCEHDHADHHQHQAEEDFTPSSSEPS